MAHYNGMGGHKKGSSVIITAKHRYYKIHISIYSLQNKTCVLK